MKKVIVAGSTGSVGTQTLDVIAANPDRFRLVGISAGHDSALLSSQAAAFGGIPNVLGIRDSVSLVQNTDADIVVNAVTGSRGLGVSLAALDAGRVLALANKESLIAAGPLLSSHAGAHRIVPVDSEHAAIAQALRAGHQQEVRRLILTASGGPFRGRQRKELQDVTPQDALRHPTWSMGRTITTNSATLMNKGFELIEAHYLFSVPIESIEVVVHRQSVVHSMVEYVDGSTIAQAARPDLRLAIASALNWPDHLPGAVEPLDWSVSHSWDFEPLDDVGSPAVELARSAVRMGGSYPAVLNAANEVAVDAFHSRAIGFLDIVDVVDAVLNEHRPPEVFAMETLQSIETEARRSATRFIRR
ncbi:1-deoxy-D-xylulose-5-phosphate reductoisomerase [Microbacterium sp. EST19A]|uniref:1-deoxy-D-xylulose-5-phosphate reductoisomerase n=1 Tax=Microbacterium sp. EST19A TaxID=2862681 RepID=UPI001CC071EA|nr:1-deoxy-D-xylulose-5-phosphate reductoisomerase [Microbacterium sp. EST19A]